MKRSLLAVVALLAFAGVAGAAVQAQSVVTPGPVTALAFQGSRVAFANGFTTGDCDRVRMWNVATGGFSRLGRGTACVKTSTGTGIATLSVAGTRAVWLHFTGGNIRDWTLWTATTTKPTPLRLRFVSRDVDGVPPIVLGNGSVSPAGDLLPYAVDDSVVVIHSNGSRAFTWDAPTTVAALAAGDGQVAVAAAGGRVTVLDKTGQVKRIEAYASPVSVVKFGGGGLLAQRGRTLELRHGDVIRTWTLPSGAELEDATETKAFYVARGKVHRFVLATGADRVIATGEHVQAEGSTVAVASGRRVFTLPA